MLLNLCFSAGVCCYGVGVVCLRVGVGVMSKGVPQWALLSL